MKWNLGLVSKSGWRDWKLDIVGWSDQRMVLYRKKEELMMRVMKRGLTGSARTSIGTCAG